MGVFGGEKLIANAFKILRPLKEKRTVVLSDFKILRGTEDSHADASNFPNPLVPRG